MALQTIYIPATSASISGDLVLSASSGSLPQRVTLQQITYGQAVQYDSPLVHFRLDGVKSTGTNEWNSGTLGTRMSTTGTGVLLGLGGPPTLVTGSAPWQTSNDQLPRYYSCNTTTQYFTVRNYVTGTEISSTLWFSETSSFSVEVWQYNAQASNGSIFGNIAGASNGQGVQLGKKSSPTVSSWIVNYRSGVVGTADDNISTWGNNEQWGHVCLTYQPWVSSSTTGHVKMFNNGYLSGSPTGSFTLYENGYRAFKGGVGTVITTPDNFRMSDIWYLNVVANLFYGYLGGNYSNWAIYSSTLSDDSVWRRNYPFGTGSAYFSATFPTAVVVSGVFVEGFGWGPIGHTYTIGSGSSPIVPSVVSGAIRLFAAVGTGSYSEIAQTTMSLSVPFGEVLTVRADMGLPHGQQALPYIGRVGVVTDDMLLGGQSVAGNTLYNRGFN